MIIKRIILLLILSLFLKSCQKETNKKKIENFEIKISKKVKKVGKSVPVFIDSLDFKYFNLEKFDLRKWSEVDDNSFKTPTKEDIVKYLQNSSIRDEDVFTNYRFYSLQKNTSKEKIITVLEGYQSCCLDLHYLVFDENNKLISDNIVAGTGGDEGWTFEQYGMFINDSTYVSNKIDSNEIDSENNESRFEIDSVVTTYRYFRNKKFIKISEEDFKKVIK